MKRILTILLAAVLLLPSSILSARGIDPEADSLSREKIRHYLDSIRVDRGRPTVALVLSGGGAKGAAHIGMVRRIEELGIPVDIVVGTSMGGLISGLFSMGYNSYDMEKVVTDADWGRLITDKMPLQYKSLQDKRFKGQHQLTLPFFYNKKQFMMKKDDAYSEEGRIYKPLSFDAKKEDEASLLKDNIMESLPFGAVKGQNVTNLISSLTAGYQEDMDFMDLPIPFVCVATDLISFKGKYWFEGSLPVALRSTMSIPFLYAPVKHDGMVLVDGGMRDNYPTAFIRSLGADIIIGMELSDPRKGFYDVNNIGDIANQMIDLLIADNYERNKDGADIKVKPDLHEFNMLSFSDENITTIVSRGYATAMAADSALMAVKAKMNGDTLTFKGPKAANLQQNKYKFDEIVISGVNSSEAKLLRSKLDIKNMGYMNDDDILKAVNGLYATHAFDNVTYSVYGDKQPFVLDLKCEKGPVSQLGLGARFDSEEVLALLLDAGFGTRKLRGPKANISLRIAENPSANIRLYYDAPRFANINLAFYGQYTNFGRIEVYDDCEMSGADIPKNILHKVQKAPFSSWHLNADFYFSGISWKTVDFRLGAKLDYWDFNKVEEGYGFRGDKAIGGNLDVEAFSSAYVNPYFEVNAESFDDIYFPTRGYSVQTKYTFSTYDVVSKKYNPFHVFSLDAKGWIPCGEHFTIIPSGNFRMALGNDIPVAYSNYLGGSIAGRYMPQQVSFIGINNCAEMGSILTVVRTDFRAKLKENHYLALQANYARDCNKFAEYFKGAGFYGAGLEYSYNTILGPLSVNVHYSNITKNPGMYVSLGVIF